MTVSLLTLTTNNQMANPEEYMDCLILERVTELDANIIRRDPEYRRLHQEIDACYQDLERICPSAPELVEIRSRLEGAIGMLEVLIERLIYMQSLRDGARLQNFLDGARWRNGS